MEAEKARDSPWVKTNEVELAASQAVGISWEQGDQRIKGWLTSTSPEPFQ